MAVAALGFMDDGGTRLPGHVSRSIRRPVVGHDDPTDASGYIGQNERQRRLFVQGGYDDVDRRQFGKL
jgi:hypothetical protein